ncbi:MAG: hypothetical protein HC804_00675 [Anaerolineae bacterium]|nr:hypothetical protein [Anaerolineae bacterium]
MNSKITNLYGKKWVKRPTPTCWPTSTLAAKCAANWLRCWPTAPHITFVDSLDELKAAIFSLRHWLRYDNSTTPLTANSRR